MIKCSFTELDSMTESDFGVCVVNGWQSLLASWTLYVNGSSTAETSGVEIILTSPEGFKVQQAIQIQFKATNNEAEYEAILPG